MSATLPSLICAGVSRTTWVTPLGGRATTPLISQVSICGSPLGLSRSQYFADSCRSMSPSIVRAPLAAKYPARLVASVVLPTPPLGFSTATTGIGFHSSAQRSYRAPCGPPGSLLVVRRDWHGPASPVSKTRQIVAKHVAGRRGSRADHSRVSDARSVRARRGRRPSTTVRAAPEARSPCRRKGDRAAPHFARDVPAPP